MTLPHTSWLRRVGLLLGLGAAFLIGLSLRGDSTGDHDGHAGAGDMAEEGVIWTCSMHPHIQMPEPGSCPICGMDLIAMAPESGGEDSGPTTLVLSERAQKLAEIQTTPVRRQEAEAHIRMVGKLEADETRVRNISARVPGRIDRLHVDYTGMSIRKGQKLFDLFSPELLSAQEELIQSIQAAGDLRQSGLESTRRSADRMIDAARDRLRLWGLTQEQIVEIENRGTSSEQITIYSPISGVVLALNKAEGEYIETGTDVYSIADLSSLWLQLDAYESDLVWLRTADTVYFETDAYPDETFAGQVAFVDPVLTERSRTIKVRVNVPNKSGRLRPGMFARATLLSSLTEENDPLPLVIPTSAPLLTGKRAVVYVAHPEKPGRFDGRIVSLGPRAGDVYVVYAGLEEGEFVVTNGAFKIDSALQIRAKQSMMNPTGGGPAPGHDHGGQSMSGGAIAGHESMEPTVDTGGERNADHDFARRPNQSHAPDNLTPTQDMPREDLTTLLSQVEELSSDLRLQFGDILALYFDLSTALSHDNFDSAKVIAGKIPAATILVEGTNLPPTEQTAWSAARTELNLEAKKIASSTDMDAARNRFYRLSQLMIETTRTFAASEEHDVLIYHCPMAMGGSGADWLQSKPGTENPYYGSKMFKCGSQTEVLIAGTPGDTPGSEND